MTSSGLCGSLVVARIKEFVANFKVAFFSGEFLRVCYDEDPIVIGRF